MTICRTLFFCLLALPPLCLPAREGLVETRDGKSYAGDIRLSEGQCIVANSVLGFVERIGASNVVAATFHPDAAKPSAGGALDWGVLPEPWQTEVVGAREVGGAVFLNGMFRLQTAGAAEAPDTDALRLVYKRLSGDGEIVARVLNAPYTDPRAFAGVTMRENLYTDSANVTLALLAGRGGMLRWRIKGGAGLEQQKQTEMIAPCWVRLKRAGNTFTAYQSNNGRHWVAAGTVKVPMREYIYVGLVVAAMRPDRVHQAIFDHVSDGGSAINGFEPRVELRSGTVLTGRFQLRDNSRLQFSGLTLLPAISLFDVARIHFQRVTTVEEAQMRRGRPGVLLTGGEFVEGDFKSLEGGRLTISSVPLGLRSFDVNTEVVALVMRSRVVKPAACEVQTADGSVWRALGFHVAQNEVVIQENSLGTWRLPVHELTSVRSLR